MRNLVKYVGMGLLVLGLAACDQKKDEAANDNGVSASQSGGARRFRCDRAGHRQRLAVTAPSRLNVRLLIDE